MLRLSHPQSFFETTSEASKATCEALRVLLGMLCIAEIALSRDSAPTIVRRHHVNVFRRIKVESFTRFRCIQITFMWFITSRIAITVFLISFTYEWS